MVNHLGPLRSYNILQKTALYLEPKDIGRLGRVCKKYNAWLNKPDIWIQASEREGVPLVAGEKRNRRADFRILYPITISGRMIGELFGKVIGKVPPISEYCFDNFAQNMADPFETNKLFKDNFVVLVDPSLIERSVDKKTPLTIDKAGNLREATPDEVVEQTLTIPFSLRNMYMLSKHPLKNKEDLPVFRQDCRPTIELSTSYPNQVGVRIMRRSALSKKMGLCFDSQAASIQRFAPCQGFEPETVRRRALFDAVSILNTGTCPDEFDEVDDFMISESITVENIEANRLKIGCSTMTRGLEVYSSNNFNGDRVVPGCSAEFPGPSKLEILAFKLERLVIDENRTELPLGRYKWIDDTSCTIF